MEYLHSQTISDNKKIIDDVKTDHGELSVTPMNVQIDGNISQQACLSGTDITLDDNGSLSTSSTILTIKSDDRTSSMNHQTHQENQQISDRTPSVNGPGLAKSISMTSSGKKSIDAALEKNLETIATQVRRTTTKPSQLTQNDLQLFDSTSTTNHHLREMTPDSINADSTNEDQQASIQNGYYYHHSVIPPLAVDLTNPPWPPAVYPFAHQHPGFYLPYPPPMNVLPAYDPLLIEKHYGAQGLSAYYSQQQAAAARLYQEHASMSDNYSSISTTSTKERNGNSPSISGDSIKSADSVTCRNRIKKTPVNNNNPYVSSLSPRHNQQTINGSLSRLSSDLSSDGGGGGENNDADSIISCESQKSNTASGMPVVEDGLSDSENVSGDEHSPSIKNKSNGRNQSTQSDFLFDSHKHQFAKLTTNEIESQANSFYIRPSPTLDQPKTSPIAEEETDNLLSLEHRIHTKNQAIRDAAVSKSSEVITRIIADPENSSVLIEGVLFRCRYLGSTQLLLDGNPSKTSRMMQAQEAVGRIKAPYGESQPSVEVDLFISTEKIMVLNTDLEDILMDHSLRSISYIADIGDLVVLMAKRRYIQQENNENDHSNGTRTRRVVSVNQKMICHVFESEESQSIAHSIGQAFQAAYVDFLKANGIDDPSFTGDMDYDEVLDQQEIACEELDRFAKKECQKDAIITKGKNEPLGIVIVESGWGSILPTVVVANMMPGGPAARGGHLNIGDQIISVNGISLVGLPLSSCQTQIKNVRHLTTVRLVVVPCPPVVEVFIRRPDTKYQLGFSVQNGIICSLLRGGIAERGGVRVGHRIIEINGQSVVATPHERIVSMLSNSFGELRMKTMPTQMYRLLTGQETPIYI